MVHCGSKGKTSDAIEAIEYAKSLGIKIVNCSFGSFSFNQALRDEIENNNILFVCAAGNYGVDLPFYPASYNLPNTISVTAIDNTGELGFFSNYGQSVEVAAPGIDIISTIFDDGYAYMDGTSFSSPFVAGVAALVLSKYKKIEPSQIKQTIMENVKKTRSMRNYVLSGGIVDANRALK